MWSSFRRPFLALFSLWRPYSAPIWLLFILFGSCLVLFGPVLGSCLTLSLPFSSWCPHCSFGYSTYRSNPNRCTMTTDGCTCWSSNFIFCHKRLLHMSFPLLPYAKVFNLLAILTLCMLALFSVTVYPLYISLLSSFWILSIPKSTGDAMTDPHWQQTMLDGWNGCFTC